MSDDKFEEFLQREARGYNAPPSSVPRDEMWRAISAARSARAGGSVRPITSGKPRLRYAPWIGMAATLLIGVGIGRYAMQQPEALAPLQTAQLPATDPLPASERPQSASQEAAPATDAPATQSLPQRPRDTASQVARNAAAASRTASSNNGAEAVDPFQLASRDHMQRAEALVSVVAATPADAVMDSLTGRWTREMLTNTRLLLDSPAGDDPARRRLLEDLEIVLVQLVQRSGGAVDERALIDRTLERTQLLTRLRTSAAGI